MKIALLQIASGGNKMDNLAMITPLVRDAAAAGATLIVLPEGASQAFEQGRLDTQAEELDGPFATGLRTLADELRVTIVAGMFRPADTKTVNGKEFNRVYNTALITGGGVHTGYDKIHTYDAFNYKESDTVCPGAELVTFVHEGTTVGVATCFDIRFPEQFQQLAARGAQVVVEDFGAARREAGDVAIAVEKGALAWDDVVAMAEVVCGEVAMDPARRVVFKTVGMPWEDLAVARVVAETAL